MTYTQRDLRAADFLALLLVAIGITLIAVGVIRAINGDGVDSSHNLAPRNFVATGIDKAVPDADAAPVAKQSAGASWNVWLIILGFICLCLGAALNLKLRQLKKTAGKEPDEWPGVPVA